MQPENITGFMTPRKLLNSSKNNSMKYQEIFQHQPQFNNLNHNSLKKKKQKMQFVKQSPQKRLQVTKLQSKRYLDSLQQRITFQIIAVKTNISDFQRKLKYNIQKHYQKLKIALKASIDNIFKQNQQQFIRLQLNQFKLSTPNLYFLKTDLLQMAQKIQKLRVQLQSQNWKNAVSQIFSNEFEKKLETLIIETNTKSKINVPIFIANRVKFKAFQKILQEVMQLDQIATNNSQQFQYGGT